MGHKAVGVNYFDAFYRVLKNPEDKSYIEGFKKLSENGIPFVRMMASGFWLKDWELYFKDKDLVFYSNTATQKNRRILFIGEFGVCSNHAQAKEDEKTLFSELVKAIQDIDVPLSALWVYDFKGQDKTCNVTYENDRAYQLRYIIILNEKTKEVVRDARRTDFINFSRWH